MKSSPFLYVYSPLGMPSVMCLFNSFPIWGKRKTQNPLDWAICLVHTDFYFYFLMLYSITVVPIFSLCPPPPSDPHSHSQSPHRRPCPWVLHICSLTNPFPFFQSVPASPCPLTAVSLLLIFIYPGYQFLYIHPRYQSLVRNVYFLLLC